MSNFYWRFTSKVFSRPATKLFYVIHQNYLNYLNQAYSKKPCGLRGWKKEYQQSPARLTVFQSIVLRFVWMPGIETICLFSAPEINISPVPDTMTCSRHIVPVKRISFRSSLYDILLEFDNLPVIVTGIKRILSVTRDIVPDNDRWPAVISCTGYRVVQNVRVWP